MKGKTHIAAGLAATTLMASWALTPEGIFAVIIGALMPDEDIDGSTISERIKGVLIDVLLVGIGLFLINIFLKKQGISFNLSSIMSNLNFHLSIKTETGIVILAASFIWSRISGHRGFAHSIAGLIVSSIGIGLIFPSIIKWFALGYISHIIIDLLNHKGEQLLYPLPMKFCLGLCEAGKLVDNILCIVFTAIFFIRLLTCFHAF